MTSVPTPDVEETIFFRALALPAAQRPAYLEQACEGNAALRGRVEELLRADDEANRGFMATAVSPARVTEPAAGTKIGRYKLLQKIGEGGCGVVYMAEQEEPVRRRVALKVIKLGMDTKEVITRFEAERQALALMDHPNIARVLDAGATEAGRPFFVMELVRGVPITKYCDEQNLPTAARLELFTQVCHAVQHAHQKGIIHRDIKPSNILVTLHDGKPVPKVIDFGIAKATQGRLTDRTLFTAFEQFIGTPAYMSPEQAEMSGLDIDTRSDIYSLGVLLYELLTGRPPFDPKTLVAAGLDEIRRIIREIDPPRMSTRLSTLNDLDRTTIARQRGVMPRQLSVLLSGDLDWIVMKALEKNRVLRYDTANDIVADIQRHLNNKPVTACPPTTAYHIRKFTKRHRVGVATSFVLAATIVAGGGISLWQAIRANGQTLLAETRRQEAEASRQSAIAAQRRTEQAARQMAGQLARESVDKGTALLAAGDPYGAWVRFAEALRLDQDDPRAAEIHRLRLGALQREFPAPVQSVAHGRDLWSIEFSPDGRRLVTASDDKTARIWNVQTGAAATPAMQHAGAVASARFNRDGTRVVTASFDHSAQVWNALDATPTTQPLRHAGRVFSAEFSPDGRRVATASEDATARIWNAITGQPLGPPLRHSAAVWSAAFSPNGRFVLTASHDHSARIWNSETGEPMASPLLHNGKVLGATFSPDGRLVATASEDRTARIWDARTGRPLTPPLPHEEEVTFVAFDPDSRRIVTASGESIWHFLDFKDRPGEARIWDVATGQPIGRPMQHALGVFQATFSPDGRHVVTACRDKSARVWDAGTGGLVAGPLRHGRDDVFRAVFSPDGRQVATSGFECVARVWDIARPTQTSVNLDDSWLAGRFMVSPDGRFVVGKYYGPSARVWSVTTGAATTPLLHSTNLEQVVFSPNGKWVATAGADGTACVWDVSTGAPVGQPVKHRGAVLGVAFSPDGKMLATGGNDQTARIWNAGTGTPLTSTLAHTGSVHGVAFSPDGRRMATASGDKTARIWDCATGAAVTEGLPHTSEVRIALFSPDGGRLATASSDGRVRVWNASTGTAVAPPMKHSGRFIMRAGITSVAFSPDGRRLVVANSDKTARIWNSDTGAPVTPPLWHDGEVNHASFSADGRFVATASDDGSARVWDAVTGQPITPGLQHKGPVEVAIFSPDGHSVTTAGYTKEHGFVAVWTLIREERPAAVVIRVAELAAMRRVDTSGTLVVLTPEGALQTIRQLASLAKP